MENKKKKMKSGNKRLAAVKALFAVLVIFTAMFIVTKTVGSVAMSNVTDAVLSFVSSVRQGGSYPYDTKGQNVRDMKRIGNDLMLVKPEGICVLDYSAAVLQDSRFKYADIYVNVRNSRAVIFDRNACGFSVVSKTKNLSEGETKGAILTAAMAKNGFVAVASMSDSAASELTVYDRAMKEYFKWECVSDYIIDMSISPNGKNIAVIVLGVKEAEIHSKLWVFEMGATKPLASFDYDGTTLVDVEYTGKRDIIVLGDNLRSVISSDMTRKDESFSGDTLSCFASAENGKQAVVLLPYGDENSAKLSVYAKDGSKSFEESFNSKVLNVACSASYAAVLAKDGVYVYDSAGNLSGLVDLKETASGIEILGTGGAIYVMFNDRVEKYTPSGEIS